MTQGGRRLSHENRGSTIIPTDQHLSKDHGEKCLFMQSTQPHAKPEELRTACQDDI